MPGSTSPQLVWGLQGLMLGSPGARGLSLAPRGLSQGISTIVHLPSAESSDTNLAWQTGLLMGEGEEGEVQL